MSRGVIQWTDSVDNPVECAGCIGSGENVLVHAVGGIRYRTQGTFAKHSQETPVQVLELPTSSNTGNLHDEDSIIVQEIVNLLQERAVSSNANMLRGFVKPRKTLRPRGTHLGHFKRDDLVECTLGVREIPEIHAEDSTLRLRNAVVSQSFVSKRGLILAEGH